jgi:hypothetical protein
MLSDDMFDQLLGEADPVRGNDLAQPDDLAATRIRARVGQRSRRLRLHRMIMMPTVTLAVVGGTAGTYAWVAGDGHGHTRDSTTVDCTASARRGGLIAFDATHEDPVQACRRQWRELFGTATPSQLTACVDGSLQGSIKVYPGGPDQCERHRADRYVGPTAQQRRLAAFRADLTAQFGRRGCTSYPKTRELITRLLAEHRLKGWMTRNLKTADNPNRREGPCAEIGHYDEPRRVIWLVDHDPHDPINYTG